MRNNRQPSVGVLVQCFQGLVRLPLRKFRRRQNLEFQPPRHGTRPTHHHLDVYLSCELQAGLAFVASQQPLRLYRIRSRHFAMLHQPHSAQSQKTSAHQTQLARQIPVNRHVRGLGRYRAPPIQPPLHQQTDALRLTGLHPQVPGVCDPPWLLLLRRFPRNPFPRLRHSAYSSVSLGLLYPAHMQQRGP